jgi:hypothetical protein
MKTNRLMRTSPYMRSIRRPDRLLTRTDRPLQNECNIWHGFLNCPIPTADDTPSTSGGEGKPAVLTTCNYDRSNDRNTTFSTIIIASNSAITHLFKIFNLKEDAMVCRRGIRWRHYESFRSGTDRKSVRCQALKRKKCCGVMMHFCA